MKPGNRPEPASLTAVLGIVYRAIAAHLIRKAGLTQATAQSGAVTLIQRFGSALNLNIHFHLLVLDGVYVRGADQLEFHRVPPPTTVELDRLLATITARVGRHLQRRGWLTRDTAGSQLTLDRPAGDRHGPAVAHRPGSGALHAEDTVPGRHHARGV